MILFFKKIFLEFLRIFGIIEIKPRE